MKLVVKAETVRLVLFWAVLIGFTVIGLHCSPAGGHHEGSDDLGETTAVPSALPVLGDISDFALIDQFGTSVTSRQLLGKVWVTTVIFTRSTSNTPAQLSAMHDLWHQINEESLWHSVRLINLTAEPEFDTPDVLRPFADRTGGDSLRWRFLTGPREEMVEVIASLGIPMLEDPLSSRRPITLSPKFVLVDRENRVRGVYDAYTDAQLSELMRDLGLLLPEAPHLDDGTGRTHLVIPPENLSLGWIESRRRAQVESMLDSDVFHDFTFSHRLKESGITFRNKIVDNAGKAWMPNHYDHGNGVAVADVDGDGKLDLYFTSQVGGNELWRNVGNGRFEDITREAGVAMPDRVGVSASFADIDNDGDPDLYVTSIREGNVLFLNDGSGKFKDVSARSGLDYEGHSSSAVFFDYNRDGLLDLFLVNVGVYTWDRRIPVRNGTSPEQSNGKLSFYEGREDAFAAHLQPERAESSRLYKNLGNGRFVDVSKETGLVDKSWSGDATPIDVDQDGWLDLYVLNMQGDDRFYKNIQGTRFVEDTPGYFPKTPWGSMGVKSFDYDNDGRMDLYLTDMHSDMSEDVDVDHEANKSNMHWPDELLADGSNNIFGNALFHQQRDMSFGEVSDVLGAENYWPWGVSVGDLNADGYLDAFVTASMNYPYRYGINSVLLNENGERFIKSAFALNVEPRAEGHTLTPWFTLDCDDADVNHEHCAGRSGQVVVWAAAGSRSSVILDLDGDGDLDIVTNDFNSEPQVLVSNLAERKGDLRYLKIRLIGAESNRDGLGARVTVKAGSQEMSQVMDGVTGYLSHGVQPLYFGLGNAASVDQITVRWPSGAVQELNGPIEVNTLLEITESETSASG